MALSAGGTFADAHEVRCPHGSQLEFPEVSPGIWQLMLVLLIVLIAFGSAKLPKVMGDLAEGLKNFKTGVRDGSQECKRPSLEGPEHRDRQSLAEAERTDREPLIRGR
jgi:sec-independent protein translocase protein TatA